MRILILADSLAIPRPHRGQPLEITWPAILKASNEKLDVWQRARPASTVIEILDEFNLFSDSISSFAGLVLQVGITDCCPRPDPYFFQRFSRYFLGKRFQRFINSNYHRLLKLRSRPWISKTTFANSVREILGKSIERNPSIKIAVIKIGPPCHNFVEKVKEIPRYVEEYNSVLEEIIRDDKFRSNVSLLNPYSGKDAKEIMINDGHHLTDLGHKLVAQSVKDALRI